MQRAGDVGVEFGLLVLGGRLLPAEEDKLAAQQPHAFGAYRQCLLGVGQAADIGCYRHPMAVGSGCRLAGVGQIPFLLGGYSLLAGHDGLDLGVGLVELQAALAAIQHHPGAVGDIQGPALDAGHRGNVQGSSDDRHVTGGATRGGGEPDHPGAIQRCGIGRRQVLGDQDRLGWDLRLLPALGGEFLQHPLTDIANVVCAGG